MQVPETDHVFVVQVAVTIPENPVVHVGVQDAPLGVGTTQVPGFVLDTTGSESHEVVVQAPEFCQTPVLHAEDKVPTYPGLHSGVHDVPSREGATQFPLPALTITGRPAHEVEVQDPVKDHTPDSHEAERVPENPVRQTGIQVVPLAAPLVQSPASELEIIGNPEHDVLTQDPLKAQIPDVHVASRVPL